VEWLGLEHRSSVQSDVVNADFPSEDGAISRGAALLNAAVESQELGRKDVICGCIRDSDDMGSEGLRTRS